MKRFTAMFKKRQEVMVFRIDNDFVYICPHCDYVIAITKHKILPYGNCPHCKVKIKTPTATRNGRTSKPLKI